MWSIMLMMSLKRSKRQSHRLSEYKTARSQWHVHLGRKSLSHMVLILPKPTRSSTCYCRRSWSSWSHTTRSRRKKSSSIWSTASGTMPCRMIQMNARSSGSKFRWLSSKGGWSLRLPWRWWRSMDILSPQTWLMWIETKVLLKPRFWRHHRPRDLGLLIPKHR